MKLKSIPRRLGYILGAQWTRDLSWTLFTILLSRQDPFLLGQIMLALGYGYLVKTAADVGLNEFLLSSFARRDARPTVLLGEVLWLKCALLVIALGVTWCIVASKANYSPELRLIVLCIAAGFGIDGISDTFFALCQARGRQDVEMRIRIPAAVLGIGFGIVSFLLGAPPLVVALYKVVESSLCFCFGVRAIGRNPFARFGWGQFLDLAQRMRSGLIFTGMAACSMFYNKLNLFFLGELLDLTSQNSKRFCFSGIHKQAWVNGLAGIKSFFIRRVHPFMELGFLNRVEWNAHQPHQGGLKQTLGKLLQIFKYGHNILLTSNHQMPDSQAGHWISIRLSDGLLTR